MKTLILFLGLASVSFGEVWLVTPEFLQWVSPNPEQDLQFKADSSAVSIDSKSCQAWMKTEEGLHKVDFRGNSLLNVPFHIEGIILSHANPKGEFLTATAGQWRVQNSEGQVVLEMPRPTNRALHVTPWQGDSAWYLTEGKENELILGKIPANGETQRFSISKGVDLWGNVRVQADSVHKRVWIGYSATTSEHIYSPILELRDWEGNLIFKKEISERALFFDSCLSEDGKLIFSRDLPTMPYTVPLYSYIESLSADGTLERLYTASENQFLDSISCGTGNTVYALQRSIFGSDGQRIVKYENHTETLIRPADSKAREVYLCRNR